MRRLILFAALLVTLGILASACGGGDGDSDDTTAESTETEETLPLERREFNPIPGNSELVVGPNRFAVALLDQNNNPLMGESGTTLHYRFSYENEVIEEQDARFVWAIPDVAGFWVADVEFDQAGQWTAEATVSQGEQENVVSFAFQVAEEGLVAKIGDPAPSTDNLTLDNADIAQVSTDEEPNMSFYQTTVSEALDAGEPFVVVFATPAFCTTRFCGPVLDNVKEVASEFADEVTFIHIEPFELDEEGQLVTQTAEDGTEQRVPVQAAVDWNLPTEPWIFVVDADGLISARFEGSAGPGELRDAIEGAL